MFKIGEASQKMGCNFSTEIELKKFIKNWHIFSAEEIPHFVKNVNSEYISPKLKNFLFENSGFSVLEKKKSLLVLFLFL